MAWRSSQKSQEYPQGQNNLPRAYRTEHSFSLICASETPGQATIPEQTCNSSRHCYKIGYFPHPAEPPDAGHQP
jgi:hypothetical protein